MTGEGSLFDVPPAAIGRFRVLHQVGAGTSGPIFRAVHPDTDAPLAIKLFTLEFADPLAVARDLERLVGVVADGDGACTVVDAGVHETTPFLVTSFAAGDPLDVALKQFGPAAIHDVLPRLQLLAAAIDAAAAQHVLHGALHPRDVLVSESDTLLTGLGVWPILARHGQRAPVRRPYRAPELSDGAVSAAADRFAFAAITYEWMTGRRVPSTFVAGDMAPMVGADKDGLGTAFARALHTDPEARHDSCSAFVAELAEIAGDDLTPLMALEPAPAAPRRAPGETGTRRGRRQTVPGGLLPLGDFPAEDDDVRMHAAPEPDLHIGSELDAAHDDLLLGPTADRQRAMDVPLHVVEPAHVATPPIMPPPSAPAVEPATVERSAAAGRVTPAEFRPPAPPPRPARKRPIRRIAAGLMLGAVVGLGIGYAFWGSTMGPDEAATAIEGEPAGGTGDAVPAPAEPGGPDTAAGPNSNAAPPTEAPAATDADPNSAPRTNTPPPAAGAEPPQRPAAATSAGNLLVRSTPAGAAVFVDDERRGVTPLTLQNVELGTRRVRVQRDGFRPEERQITLTRARPSRSVDLQLSRSGAATRAAGPRAGAPAGGAAATARTGSLVIESRPPGATIQLNGRLIGTTPMTIDDLEPGTYTVRLQLETYRPITTTVRVVAGARARAAASLTSVLEPQ